VIKFLIVLSLIALAVILNQRRKKKVLPQQEEKKAVYNEGIKVNLTEEETREAIDWGIKNKDSPEVFLSSYEFGSQEAYEERGFIVTKFRTLASLGYTSVKTKHKVDTAHIQPEVKKAIQTVLNTKVLVLDIITYGDEPDFAKDYHIVLKQGEKIIQPVGLTAPQRADTTTRFPQSPSYKAWVEAQFPYSKLDPKGKTTVILIKDQGDSRFEVDFSHYK